MNIKNLFQRLVLGVIFVSILSVFAGFTQVLRVRRIVNHAIIAQQLLIKASAPIKEVFFPPRDKVRPLLRGLIEAEQKSISMAMYSLTDEKIALSLIEAHQRNVKIEIVTDLTQSAEKYSRIPLLRSAGICIYTFPRRGQLDKQQPWPPLMHNKFTIFHKSLENRSILVNGSLNLTQSAIQKNKENIHVCDDKELIDKYVAEFEELKILADLLD